VCPAPHEIAAVAVPPPVVGPIFHVQLTFPELSAELVPRPCAVLTRRLGNVTVSVHESFALDERAVNVSSLPGEIGLISELIVTVPD
jgi:hypothetical protein